MNTFTVHIKSKQNDKQLKMFLSYEVEINRLAEIINYMETSRGIKKNIKKIK